MRVYEVKYILIVKIFYVILSCLSVCKYVWMYLCIYIYLMLVSIIRNIVIYVI